MNLRSSTVSVAVSLLALSLASCQRETPASVCAAEETLEMVRYLAVDAFLQNEHDVDRTTWETAFDEFVSFELIMLEGYDRDTNRISCKTNIATPVPVLRTLYVEYFRQPEAGTGEHLYGITLSGDDAGGWRDLLGRIDDRYRQLSRFQHSQTDVEAQIAVDQIRDLESSTGEAYPSTSGVGSFPVSHRGPSASIVGIVGINTEAALMTGAVTAQDARSDCAYETDDERELERCVRRVMAANRQELAVSANCSTGDLLALDGTPYRRVTANGQARWRNEATENVISEDAMVEGAATLHAQFRRLCPAAAAGVG